MGCSSAGSSFLRHKLVCFSLFGLEKVEMRVTRVSIIFPDTFPVTKASPMAKTKGQESQFTCFKRPEAPGLQVTGVKRNRLLQIICSSQLQ